MNLPAPTVDSVEPHTAWTGEVTAVQIEGHGFVPRILHDLNRSDPEVDDAFQVWVEGPDPGPQIHRFNAVHRVDDTTLEARVPQGLDVGMYRLWVASPSGEPSPRGLDFEVTATRADHLMVDADDLIHEIGHQGTFRVALMGPDDERVFEDLMVTLEAVDETGNRVGTFSHSLKEKEVSKGWLLGSLGPYGESLVGLTVELPTLVTIIATPHLAEGSMGPGDSLKMSWVPGSDTRVRFELPQGDFQGEAGAPFWVELFLEDMLGNPIDEVRDLTLTNACGSWVDVVTVKGHALVEVTLTTATGGGRCGLAFDSLYAGGEAEGESLPFQVLPGPTATFDLLTTPNPVRAGAVLQALVTATDLWSNRSEWVGEPSLQDSQGGFIDVACDAPISSSVVCSGISTIAGDAVALEAAQGALSGESSPYRVLAEPVIDDLELVMSATPFTAGSPAPVAVWAYDRWGNLIKDDDPELELTDWLFSAAVGPVSCHRAPTAVEGAVGFGCELQVATPSEVLTLTAGDVETFSVSFEVQNGPLAVLESEVSTRTIEAGEILVLSLDGADAWGNPYLVQADPLIDIQDTSGTWSVPTVVLDESGQASVEGTLTQMGEHMIEMYQAATRLGGAPSVTVTAGVAEALDVTILEPWAWVGSPTPVRIELVDAYGNRVDEDRVGDGRVNSLSTSSPEVAFSLVNGLGTVDYVWSESSFGDELEAVFEPVSGLSQVRMVGLACGEDGPGVVARFGGAPEASACWDPGAETAWEGVSFLWTSIGLHPLYAYGLQVGAEEPVVQDVSTFDVDLGGLGVHSLRVWTIDEGGCASEDTAWGYVGEDDGEVVGLVPLEVSPSSLPVRSPIPMTLEVGPAKDCSRDLASGATVYLRVSRGVLGSVSATGQGLSVSLDTLGEGEVDVWVDDVMEGGEVRVEAWVDSGAATGTGLATLLGDESPPVVWDQEPQGVTLGLVEHVRFTFSEPMLEESFEEGVLDVDGPMVTSVIGMILSEEGNAVEFLLDPPVDGSLGVYTVLLDDQVRDAAGNLLDGGWTGAGGSLYFGTFGATAVVVDDVACGLGAGSTGRFHPDGDDGEGEEADTVTVNLESLTTPAWWWATVRDLSTGGRLFKEWVVPESGTDSWVWDGRDASGTIARVGDYQLEFQAIDASGNASPLCSVVVGLAQHGGTHE